MLEQCKHNSTATWNLIRQIVPKQNNSTNNDNFDRPKEKVEEFNNFFVNVGKNTYELT